MHLFISINIYIYRKKFYILSSVDIICIFIAVLFCSLSLNELNQNLNQDFV